MQRCTATEQHLKAHIPALTEQQRWILNKHLKLHVPPPKTITSFPVRCCDSREPSVSPLIIHGQHTRGSAQGCHQGRAQSLSSRRDGHSIPAWHLHCPRTCWLLGGSCQHLGQLLKAELCEEKRGGCRSGCRAKISVNTRHGGAAFCRDVSNSAGEKFLISGSCWGWMNWWEAGWVRRKVSDWLPHDSQQLWAKIILGLNNSTSSWPLRKLALCLLCPSSNPKGSVTLPFNCLLLKTVIIN